MGVLDAAAAGVAVAIKLTGQPATLVRPGVDSPYDPATARIGAETETTESIRIRLEPWPEREAAGVDTTVGRGLVAAAGITMVPRRGDRVRFSSEDYRVLGVDTTWGTDGALLYELHLEG